METIISKLILIDLKSICFSDLIKTLHSTVIYVVNSLKQTEKFLPAMKMRKVN